MAARIVSPPMTDTSEIRLDKWLWAARCFKTRAIASVACTAGHVKVNGASVKPAKAVRVGDEVEVRTPAGLRVLEIAELSERRGPAAVAKTLYLDHSPPPPPKEEAPMDIRRERGAGRPSKQDRRAIRKLRGY
jgi:ribosome-associated heat shock protein Hsp15